MAKARTVMKGMKKGWQATSQAKAQAKAIKKATKAQGVGQKSFKAGAKARKAAPYVGAGLVGAKLKGRKNNRGNR